VLQILQDNCFFAKLSKCVFDAASVDYLGKVISTTIISAYPAKLQAVADWPTPESFTSLRAFIGLTGYYRKFMHHYASIVAPLTDLLKCKAFPWMSITPSAFSDFKLTMISRLVLHLPDFSLPFDVPTDASQMAIGAMLSQQHYPIAFFSKKLSAHMKAASAYDREMLAISEVVRKWRQYLLGRKFHIYTEQHSLRGLINQRIQTLAQQKWLTKLLRYNFEIRYTPGPDNIVADALSCFPASSTMLFSAATSIIPAIFDHLRRYYIKEADGQVLITHLSTQTNPQITFFASNGLVLYKDRIFKPDFGDWRLSLLTDFNDTMKGGHFGVRATSTCIATSFNLPGLLSDIKKCVRRCATYHHNKYNTQKPLGTLQRLPLPR
ncbi:UNVERIFIED_CONTAM: Retrovirus-related Pol polyprotein from transposon, partial [Sesamum angustifolium]